jgi:poly-beta-1,6-N-acetyl-D-glucosamine synthase
MERLGQLAFVQQFEVPALFILLGIALIVLQATWFLTSLRRLKHSPRAGAPNLAGALSTERLAERPHITAIIPAHNEESCIGSTLTSMLHQSVQPDLIVVVADNCTDATATVVRNIAATNPRVVVIDTVNNKHRKAGALNQAWREVRSITDIIVQVDADTHLATDVIEQALIEFDREPTLAAVTGTYRAHPKPPPGASVLHRTLWRIQRLEFELAAGIAVERGLDPLVLSGTCTVFRIEALEAVNTARNDAGPWDNESLVEDFAITLDLQSLGRELLVSQNLVTRTETMPRVVDLWKQRLRWQQGTLVEVRKRGLNRVTWPTASRQLALVLAIVRYLCAAALIAAYTFGSFPSQWNRYRVLAYVLVATLMAFNYFYRLKRRRQLSWGDRMTAITLIPMEIFTIFRCAVFVVAGISVARGTERAWR